MREEGQWSPWFGANHWELDDEVVFASCDVIVVLSFDLVTGPEFFFSSFLSVGPLSLALFEIWPG
jgi:hypothetical protein